MVSNPRLLPFPIASTTGELADANQLVVSGANLTGLLLNSGDVQTALARIDATGLGAPIFTFTGNFAAAGSNIAQWFNGQATRHMQGASGQTNALRTFDLPGTTALNTVFDTLVADGLSELYRLTISYLGGTSGTSVTTNRLLVRPRISPSPQIDGRANITLAHGDTVTLEITRSSGTISSYSVVSEGRLAGSPGSDILNDIELRTQSWDATANATLPGTGQVQTGYAFRVINAPVDGSGRFNQVMYDGDWVVWSAVSFTQWSDVANWFVIPGGDVRRLTLAGQTFLEHVGTTNKIVRGNNYADTALEIRMQLYTSENPYSAADLNTNGQIDQYTGTADVLGSTIAIRLTGTQATLAATLPSLYVYAEDPMGRFTRLGNLSTDFTHQGDFATESDYTADTAYNYNAGDILRIYETSLSEFNTISDYDATDNIPDDSLAETKLAPAVQNKINAQGPSDELPPALKALNSQARVFNITHSNYRSNNSHVYLNNSFAALKNAPTTFPNTASAFVNEITGSATEVGDPSPVTAIQDVSRVSGGTMSGAGITGAQFPITFIDDNNWRCIIGGWMYYQTLPTSYEPIFQVRERRPTGTVYRDIFGMGPSGFTFKRRATVGGTTNVGITHHLINTDGLLEPSLQGSSLGTDFRVYTSGTYQIRVTGRLNNALVGGASSNYTITAVNISQAETTFDLTFGAITQTFRVEYNALRGRFSGRAHELSVSVDSIETGLDELVVEVLSASTTVATTSGNTYTDVTLSDGHAAAGRLMRYIVSFRSLLGGESDELEAVIGFFGYDDNGNPTLFQENTIELGYPALDLRWATTRYGAGANTIGVHQNVQGMVLNPDTPLLEYPRHATINGWLSTHDDKVGDWVWGNIHGPDQDTEAVYFPEFVNFSNLIFESPNRTKYRLTIADDGTLKTEVVT